MLTDHSGFRPGHSGEVDSPFGGRADVGADSEPSSCPDLASLCDAFDTDDVETQPEPGDFWEQPDEEE